MASGGRKSQGSRPPPAPPGRQAAPRRRVCARRPRVRPPRGRAARPWTGLLTSKLGVLAHTSLLVFPFGLSTHIAGALAELTAHQGGPRPSLSSPLSGCWDSAAPTREFQDRRREGGSGKRNGPTDDGQGHRSPGSGRTAPAPRCEHAQGPARLGPLSQPPGFGGQTPWLWS